jgi:hypothetical protein
MTTTSMQTDIEELGITTVQFNYYPGAHWDCELKTLNGRHVTSAPAANMQTAYEHAMWLLEQEPR